MPLVCIPVFYTFEMHFKELCGISVGIECNIIIMLTFYGNYWFKAVVQKAENLQVLLSKLNIQVTMCNMTTCSLYEQYEPRLAKEARCAVI